MRRYEYSSTRSQGLRVGGLRRRANNDFFSLKPKPTLAFDGMFVDEASNASVLVDRHSQRIDLRTKRRMRAHIVDDLAHTRKQPGVIQHRLPDIDAVLTQLPSLADQSGCMGQSPHRNRPVIGRTRRGSLALCVRPSQQRGWRRLHLPVQRQ
jgi:hypothetical protein